MDEHHLAVGIRHRPLLSEGDHRLEVVSLVEDRLLGAGVLLHLDVSGDPLLEEDLLRDEDPLVAEALVAPLLEEVLVLPPALPPASGYPGQPLVVPAQRGRRPVPPNPNPQVQPKAALDPLPNR